MISIPLGLLLVLSAGPVADAAPCLRPSRAGTQVQGEVRICPGRYRIADPNERGVIIAASSGTRIDLTGVVLESGDSVAPRFVGVGIASSRVDNVSVLGGTVRGYRFGVRLEGGRGHRITGVDASGSRAQALRATAASTATASTGWIRCDPEIFQSYGGGILLQGTIGATVTGASARGGAEWNRPGGGARELCRGQRREQQQRLGHPSVPRVPQRHRPECGGSHGAVPRHGRLRRGRHPDPGGQRLEHDLRERPDAVQHRPAPDRSGAAHPRLGREPDLPQRRLEGPGERVRGRVRLGGDVPGESRRQLRERLPARPPERQRSPRKHRDRRAVGGDPGGARAGQHDRRRTSWWTRGSASWSRPRAPARRRAAAIGSTTTSSAGAEQGIVLQSTTGSRVRGNLFDGVGDGLLVDGTGHATEVTGNVFLRASGWFIDAPDLAAGGNFWATADAAAASARVKGRISVLPWRSATAAGY